jgi:hypothetical protein
MLLHLNNFFSCKNLTVNEQINHIFIFNLAGSDASFSIQRIFYRVSCCSPDDFFLGSIKKMEKSNQQKNRGPCIGKGEDSGLFF